MKAIKLDELKKEPVSHNPKISKRVFMKKGEVPSDEYSFK